MSGDEKKQQNKKWLWAIFRVGFAIFAIAFVIRTVQFNDMLYLDKIGYKVISIQANVVIVEDNNKQKTYTLLSREENILTCYDQATGKRINFKYQPGLITICKKIDFSYALSSLALFSIVPIFLSLRWQILLKAVGINVNFLNTLKIVFAGRLMNFFFISTTGGDLFKAYWVSRKGKRTEAFVSVFVDRFLGFAFITILAAILCLIFINDPNVNKLIKPIFALVMIFVLFLVVLFSSAARRLVRFDRWEGKVPFHHILVKVDNALMIYRNQPKVLLKAGIYTAGIQLGVSTANYLFGKSIGIDVSVWYYYLYVPLAFIVGSIPISIFWGLGLMEGAYIVFFTGSGFATATQSAMLAMGARLLQLIWSLPGAIVILKLPPAGKLEETKNRKVENEKNNIS